MSHDASTCGLGHVVAKTGDPLDGTATSAFCFKKNECQFEIEKLGVQREDVAWSVASDSTITFVLPKATQKTKDNAAVEIAKKHTGVVVL